MSNLQVGRVGLDVDMNSPQDWGQSTRFGEWVAEIGVVLRGSTTAETIILKTELQAQVGQLVPVLYATDPTVDGFYILSEADVDAFASDAAYGDPGLLKARLVLTRIGAYSNTEIQSLLSLVSAVEDYSTTPSFWWSPSIGARAVDAGGAAPVLITRDGETGTIDVATDLPAGVNPTWSVEPARYYDGAVEIWAADRLRTGPEMPMNVTDWYMSNGFMEIRPSAFQGTSDGELQVRFHDGTDWGDWIDFLLNHAGSNPIQRWDYVSIVRNTAAVCTIRLVRDALEAPTSTTAKHELDITLRRGGRLVSCLYKFTGSAATHSVEQSAGDAATRPLGASYITGTDLVSGDKWLLGSPRDFSLTGAEITLDVAAKSFPFFIAAAVDNAATGTGNGPGDLAEQYVGQVAETVRAVRR